MVLLIIKISNSLALMDIQPVVKVNKTKMLDKID